MNHEEKITSYQLLLLATFFTVGSSILELPSTFVKIAEQDAWIAMLLGIAISAIMVGLYILLIRLYPGKNLHQINETVFGRKIGSVVSLYVTFGTFFLGPPTVIYYLGRFLSIQIMVETPPYSTHVLFGLLAIFAVALGIEVIARVAEILFPIFLFLYLGLMLLLLPQVEFERLQPVLEHDFKTLLWTSIFYVQFSCFPIIIMLNNFQGKVVDQKKIPKAFFLGSFFGGAILFIITLISVLVLGRLTALVYFPSYILAQKINVGNFIERIEMVITVMWFITLYFKLVLYFDSAVVGFAETFKIKNHRLLAVPLGVLIIYFSLTNFPNDAYQLKQDETTWIPHSFFIGVVYPILVLIIGFVQRKLSGKRKAISRPTES
jgi:spore germination protein KB